jgi:hypothetical protein
MGLLLIATGCGGGGGPSSWVEGFLVDQYGAAITSSAATMTLDGTDVVGHPDSVGHFKMAADPGSYTLRGIFTDVAAGILLKSAMPVQLVQGQTLSVGKFILLDQNLSDGWAKYRAGDYAGAQVAFNLYLDTVRSAQAVLGCSSAYSGLGWALGNGLNSPSQALAQFQEATDGWSANGDAWVGTAAADLGSMKAGGHFSFNQAVEAITTAINLEGDYTSSPAHDKITETDLEAFRALLNFLNGNSSAARSEALSIQQLVNAAGNPGSMDSVAIILKFTQ